VDLPGIPSATDDARAQWVLRVVLQAEHGCTSLALYAPPPHGLCAKARQERRPLQQVIRGRA
jgi:hypothetical protein